MAILRGKVVGMEILRTIVRRLGLTPHALALYSEVDKQRISEMLRYKKHIRSDMLAKIIYVALIEGVITEAEATTLLLAEHLTPADRARLRGNRERVLKLLPEELRKRKVGGV